MALDDGYIAVIDKQSRLIQTAKTAINHEWVCQRIGLNLDDVDMKVCLDFLATLFLVSFIIRMNCLMLIPTQVSLT
ncbi:MAG: hypothetical protein HC836_40290 [Richelia sp. RM2_1_2]|nr:hypothetical protein [Richelia sp. RM2_1_2]